MIWTYDMDLTVSKLVYLNSPEILVESIRDKTKNYHSVLEEFNKKFKLQVKQSRTVRSRFERLLLDYKKRSAESYVTPGRESELDLVLKGIVKLEKQFYSTYDARKGETLEKMQDLEPVRDTSMKHLDFDRNAQKLKPRLSLQDNSPVLQEISSNNYGEINKSGNKRSRQDKTGLPEGPEHNFADSEENPITGSQSNLDSETVPTERATPHDGIRSEEPLPKKYKRSIQPSSQPFYITNYFSDNKTMIMNGDGVQNVNGNGDILELTERTQQDLELLKQDMGQLSSLSKQIAMLLKRATSSEESDSEVAF